MNLFLRLKKQHGLRSVRCKGQRLRYRELKNTEIVPRFLAHWEKHAHHEWPTQPWYSGIGLHYHKDCKIQPLTKQLCGNDGRDDYHDTISYDLEIFPGLLAQFGPFTSVRSKITCMSVKSDNHSLASSNGWHRDETPFEALRVVIPLSSNCTYQFQIDNAAPIAMIPGNAYAFDQSQYHRVFSTGPSNVNRIHLVLSFVTWFDKIGEEWIPNQFFNKVHPLDLFDLVDL